MTPRILVAGIGNMFLGDDGFGVEVARRLVGRALPDGVRVVDYGTRGMDLAYALLDDYDALVLVDIAPRGELPGTLSLIEPRLDAADQEDEAAIDTHGMDPVKVLALARTLGTRPTRTFLVACEPGRILNGADFEDVLVELSEPVQAAVEPAVRMVESLVDELSGALAN